MAPLRPPPPTPRATPGASAAVRLPTVARALGTRTPTLQNFAPPAPTLPTTPTTPERKGC
ncbi:hypothetical protein SLV14_004732 [Streptomyces sp. Je 1-4]|uniref:hypothetical protein n=1 Tax=Streptomyces TaxID=1883 RepID=UPI0021D876E7|nr:MULTISPECIES: hypothetical protein [unclassified Streptomyces]UYB41922.1 hypothetical protein SLV14_004732 [Streptomyces sp. Je 1-4]UZQ38192.1 hypothetical protein SLV14N_004732 [Streptomyces sp. Je 1-4] [Streptomyces sp. Je 1-4 4N24]UZQ45609.1 hypothetical protein SLV14NA_004732 [Streptomyces sp. Je 1-4] [Streptomyces sp. Je 1-4 4N24_ara]